MEILSLRLFYMKPIPGIACIGRSPKATNTDEPKKLKCVILSGVEGLSLPLSYMKLIPVSFALVASLKKTEMCHPERSRRVVFAIVLHETDSGIVCIGRILKSST
jgi:hypothetical protein